MHNIMIKKNVFFYRLLISFLISSLSKASFDYKYGGDDWNELCKDGQKQSPVNIDTKSIIQMKSTYFYLLNAEENNFTVTNNSNEYTVISENLGDVFFYLPDSTGKTNEYSDYVIKNVFIHSPSEHTINNKSYDLEIQVLASFNYGNLNYSYHMFSLLCTADVKSEDTDEFFKNILEKKKTLDLNSLIFQDQTNFKTFVYEGSLTTPPCNENVIWFVRKTPIKISHNNLKAFQDKWQNNLDFANGRGNNRNVRALNNRNILSNEGENIKNLH